jgi:hypothetical protein
MVKDRFTAQDMSDLADSWIRYQRSTINETADGDRHPDFDAVMVASGLARKEPGLCLQFLTAMLNRTNDEEVLAVLAAGPLEDMLVYHGAEVIDAVEKLAHEDNRFRQLLFGVWRNTIDASTWRRLEELRRDH